MVIDKTSAVDYCTQLIGTCHQLVVHRNRLKLFHGNAPKYHREATSASMSCPRPSYADVVKNNSSTASSSAGSTSSVEEPTYLPWQQRIRCPPERYGNPVAH